MKTKREKHQINKKKWKWRRHNRQQRNAKDHKRLLSATICQQNGQLVRNG